MLAKEIMTKPVIAVSPLTPVKSLAKILIKNNISGVPVLDNRKRLVGIVSEHDLLSKKGSQVKSIMSDKVVGVSEDTPVEEIASLMTTRKVKRLPVMRGEQLAGIVSRADIVRAMAMGEHVAVYTPIYDL
jgi:tRNA nucleotidyltransferase (CCA-adding enzyme)